MFIYMTKDVALSVAKFLNARFSDRVAIEGHSFSVVQFAKEIGVERGTLLNMMNEKKVVQGVDSDVISALYAKYQNDFMIAFAADGARAKAIKEAKKEAKKKKGQGA